MEKLTGLMVLTSSVDTFLLYTNSLVALDLGYFVTHPCVLYAVVLILALSGALICWASPGGPAWGACKGGRNTIPGPRGLPFLGSLLHMAMGGQPHRSLANLATQYNAKSLMSFSLGWTRVVISSTPEVAKELLTSSSFVDRPLKESAKQLQFGRAIGFAPYGEYWRKLRRIAASHLFSPKRMAAHEEHRQKETTLMLHAIAAEASRATDGVVIIRPFLQRAALNIITMAVFGRRYDFGSKCPEAIELHSLVRQGFDILGAFNIADHLPPTLRGIDPQRVHEKCRALMGRVSKLVREIIEKHRVKRAAALLEQQQDFSSDFVDVLLGLQDDDKLDEDDMVAVLWEMIFRGTDTVAILTEWVLAELILNPQVQSTLHHEIESVMAEASKEVRDMGIACMPYLQAVVKETLRKHPPGPLLSWARLATEDTCLGGHFVPCGTSAMVNMWAITHDPSIWQNPEAFLPERFLASDVDIRGCDLRLAPFGGGRRACPGRTLGLNSVNLWVARLIRHFRWDAAPAVPVDLTEVLKLSSEMLTPLHSRPLPRIFSQNLSRPCGSKE